MGASSPLESLWPESGAHGERSSLPTADERPEHVATVTTMRAARTCLNRLDWLTSLIPLSESLTSTSSVDEASALSPETTSRIIAADGNTRLAAIANLMRIGQTHWFDQRRDRGLAAMISAFWNTSVGTLRRSPVASNASA